MNASLLADVVVVLHLAYAGFVVLGYVAIVAGWAAGWAWVRRRGFRLAHLAAIAIVAVEAVAGWICPLTWLENLLRADPRSGTFIGRLAREMLYYDFPPWVFTASYLALVALALALHWLVPPHPRKRSARNPSPGY